MESTRLIVGIITGAIGAGYFIYGKRQSRAIPMLSGAGLCAIPYFVDNIAILLLACVALIVAPFVIKV